VGLKLRAMFLCCVLFMSLSPRRSEASSICSGCAAALVGAVVGVGVGLGTAIYFVHRSHTSLTGCVSQSEKGLTLSTRDASYQLLDAPTQVKPGNRFALRGHKSKQSSLRTFRIDHVAHDYGACVS